MITKTGQPRCNRCGKFISWTKPYYVYTPYGGYRDQEPPDEEHMCGNCYKELIPNMVETLHFTSWQKPLLINGGKNDN